LAGGGSTIALPAPRTTPVSAEEAVAVAVNELRPTRHGFGLRNPSFGAAFTSTGVVLSPRGGGPEWRWRLSFIGSDGVDAGPIRPTRGRLAVDYDRGSLVERYRLKSASVEQQFVLGRAPFGARARDLVIEGRVSSEGAFERFDGGWLWRNGSGAVTLGGVTVFDARGKTLPAQMRVTTDSTRIVVDGAALARAVYPVTVDPEIGANDFPISQLVTIPDRDASQAAVAYNSSANEYLVVWRGDGTATDDEFEIFGQRIDAATGAEVGTNDFRISDMGEEGSTLFAAANPAVAYNAQGNQYLVVWRGDDNTAPLVDDEFEIFGQRLTATGAQTGTNDFRISDMGPDGNTVFGAFNPAVVWKSSNNQFLVVWQGDDAVDGEFEIYRQRLDASGTEIGTDYRISDMGTDGDARFDAMNPAVAYSPTSNEFLVVWDGDDDTAPLVESETEIFGQRLNAFGNEVGTNDFRISDMGPDGSTFFDAANPALVYNATTNEYLVAWEADDDTVPLVDGELEIFGQRLTVAGAETGANDFRISDMGPDGNPNFAAAEAGVAYNASAQQYLVVWRGDDGALPLVDNEFEIFGQRLDGSGTSVGANDFRLSDMGTDGKIAFEADQPAVARTTASDQFLVVWQGDDDTPPFTDNAFDIFGQRYAPDVPTAARLRVRNAIRPVPERSVSRRGRVS
jgi:hypothetical protein